jgi:small-conductance mechanosensitive channel
VGREYNRRLKAAFDAAGIGMALQTLAARQPEEVEPVARREEPRAFAGPERHVPT